MKWKMAILAKRRANKHHFSKILILGRHFKAVALLDWRKG